MSNELRDEQAEPEVQVGGPEGLDSRAVEGLEKSFGKGWSRRKLVLVRQRPLSTIKRVAEVGNG
jgi:hypothetical protein